MNDSKIGEWAFVTAGMVTVCAILTLGGFITISCVDYIVHMAFGADLPWAIDLVLGVLVSPLLIPMVVACLVAGALGVPTPFF